MKKLFKISLIIILLILIIFLSMFIREIYIIEKLKNKAIELREITNYSYYEEKEFDSFGKKTENVTRFNNTLIVNTEQMKSIYFDTLEYHIYKDYGFYSGPIQHTDLALKSISDYPNSYLTNYFSGLSLNEKTYDLAMYINIKNSTFDGIKCYAVSYKQKNNDIFTVYINKDTLLIEGKTLFNNEENKTYINKADIELNNQKSEDFVLENHLKEYEKYVPGSTNY